MQGRRAFIFSYQTCYIALKQCLPSKALECNGEAGFKKFCTRKNGKSIYFPVCSPLFARQAMKRAEVTRASNRIRGQRRRLAGNCIPGADSPPLVQRNEKYRSVIHQSSAAAIVPSACPLFRVCAITGSARSVRRQFLPCLEREHGAGRLPPGSLTDGYTSIPPERKVFRRGRSE